ncbi:protein rigor mortis [Anopheles bellator]|uniref:protein rigor mortis n=1 Tax=Anopheles bellator TaxID=139047 RepID=UPI0026489CC9|nr:protein rigor mortis [Anopheles bellator]
MDEFTVPILHEWYHQNSIIATPDHGLLYSSRFDMCYIPPLASGEQMPKVKIINHVLFFPSGRTIKSLACAPDWQKERTFAVLDSANIVCVYDLDREEPIKGHRAHVASLNPKKGKDTDQHKAITSALCFSTNGKLLSCDHSTLVIYCVLSNRYKIYGNLFDKKSVVVVLTRVPNDPSVYVAGMQNGLIQIFTIKKPSILHSLRRHGHEIVSIDLLAVPVLREEKPRIASDRTDHQNATGDEKKSRPKKKAHKKGKTPTADTSDFLDIYNFDDNQDEFGAGIDRDTKDLKQDKFRDKNKTMEGFNFLEACQNLKEDILKAATRRNQDESESDDEGEEEHTPEFNTDDENELDDCEQQRDCGRVSGDDGDKHEGELSDDSEDDNYERKLIIVSGSREQNIFFWDYETGLPIGKVVVQADTPKRLCNTIFTNAVWLDERHIVANTSSGSVVEWKVEAYRKNNFVNLRTVLNPQPYPVDKIFHVIRANSSDGRYVWCSSINRKLICLRVVENEAPSVARDYSCVVPKNRCLVESPIESMVIAVASSAPRIAVTNLMNLQPDCIPIKHFSNNIGNIVTALAWHPEEEEKLAFGTCDGRVGILNTESVTNGPILLNAFINKDVYALCWGYLTDDKNQRQLALFASGKTELAYYYLSGPGKFKPIVCKQFGKVSNVNIVGKLCFIGTQEGEAFVTDLDHNMATLFRGHVTTPMRYITSLEYKGDLLAVGSSCLKISLVDFSKGFHDCGEKNITTLEGHEDTICQLRWSRGDTMRLVSASFDKTVRVWDAPSSTCLKVYNTGSFTYSAMFSPLDENIIIYVAAYSSLAFFDYTKDHPRQKEVKIETSASRKSKNSTAPKIQIPWARSEDVEPAKPKTFEDTKAPSSVTASDGTGTGNAEEIAKSTNDAIDDLADKVQQVTLKAKKARHLPVKEVTTFSLAYREANKPKETLACIVKMLHTVEPPPTDPLESNQNGDSEIEDSDIENENDVKKESVEEPSIEKVSTIDSRVEDGPVYYNEKLFSTEEKLKQLIEEEVKHSMASKKYSIGFVMLPHLLHKLKDTILERIAKKDLTIDLLALAPYISHIFWRQCCQAYGYQLIENGNSLASVPYFLASHNVDDAIETLCDGKYYREAWAICRLQKMPDDPINEKLATDWAEYLESVGNLEAAALVWTGVKKYENATKALLKRKELSKNILQTIDELHVKIQEAKSTKEK